MRVSASSRDRPRATTKTRNATWAKLTGKLKASVGANSVQGVARRNILPALAAGTSEPASAPATSVRAYDATAVCREMLPPSLGIPHFQEMRNVCHFSPAFDVHTSVVVLTIIGRRADIGHKVTKKSTHFAQRALKMHSRTSLRLEAVLEPPKMKKTGENAELRSMILTGSLLRWMVSA
ncbi:hypothetical protein C8R44DRAFT_740470 [Mycena epipterygia]|nr:hypothetical protein C8R44DRAFT_740470 [Mycena epipterygia]